MSKTILITGANRGIGLELVRKYAKSDCTVLACCRDPNNATELQHLSHSGSAISIHQLDVSNESHINEIAKKFNNTQIDILFNNAGISGADKQLGVIKSDDLTSTFKVNTIAPVMLTQALINQVANSQTKMIVNISSSLASIELNTDPSWFLLAYRISKSALNCATRALANQLKSRGITVLAMDPGWVQTDMGGKNADLTVEESVNGIFNTLTKISIEDSGKFIRYNGQTLPW